MQQHIFFDYYVDTVIDSSVFCSSGIFSRRVRGVVTRGGFKILLVNT